MTLSSGQALAISQLKEICQADPYAFEIRAKELPSPERKFLWVKIGLHCGTLLKREGGLPLRERELFWIYVPADFPFSKPSVMTPHTRFAGWPHVQWKKHLCLYQAPETEWDPADGMYGFIERLWLWLCHGAANELNPPDLPIHPPVAYTSESEYILVPKTNTPTITDSSWLGWAELHKSTDIRFDVIGWQSIDDPIKTSEISAPVVLLSKELPWEMPSKLEDLIIELEAQGISRSVLISLLRISILQNDKNQPLLFIIGTPQRGGAGGKERHQHLMAWHIDPLLVDTARMSLEKFSGYGPLRDIGKDAELLFFEIVKTIDISWIKVLENRPEVTIRRDFNSPIQVFAGASVCLWGCGAIGSHAAYVLVKAGISRIVLIDNGIVKPGLLVRQMYDDIDVGLSKADMLASRLRKLRPDLIVEAYCLNILGILEPENDWTYGADIVLDCTASHSMQAKLQQFPLLR